MDKRTRHYHRTKKVIRQWLIVLTVLIAVVYISQPVQTPVSPCPESGCVVEYISKVHAAEPVLETIEDYIAYKFGKDADNALKIARCESQREGKIQPDLIGDTHLIFQHNGETLGDSVGVYQIRTGGKEKSGKVWNRAKSNGMTADEFRTQLKDHKYNIDYAKSVFDNAKGWTPWYNCMRKVL